MNSAIPVRCLLSPHSGLPADSCLVVQAAPRAAVTMTTPVKAAQFSSGDKWCHWLERWGRSYHVLMLTSHTALQTLSLAVISAEKATILNVSAIKFLCPDLPLAFCMITALAPACGIKNKGTQLFFCVSLKKSMQQNWTSTSGNQHSRAEVNASLHQLRGWSHCTALRGFTFPMDDDKIHSSNSYIKVKQMKQKIDRTVYPKGSA